MIILGIILLVIGLALQVPALTIIGGILLAIGIVLFVAGRLGAKIGGRSHWF